MATHQHSDLCRNHGPLSSSTAASAGQGRASARLTARLCSGILFDHSKFHWFPYNYRMRVKLLLLELRRRVQQEELLVPEVCRHAHARTRVGRGVLIPRPRLDGRR